MRKVFGQVATTNDDSASWDDNFLVRMEGRIVVPTSTNYSMTGGADDRIVLTRRGRMLASEVTARLLLAGAASIDRPMSFMIKDDWLRGPMGPVMRRLGAVGIDRSRANNVVDAMVDELRRRDHLWLVIPPEGTRSRADHWKSGFYHIARGADDILERTGNGAGNDGRSKRGDFVLTIDPNLTRGAELRVVIEAKDRPLMALAHERDQPGPAA